MKTADALAYFRNRCALAKAAERKRQSVQQWGDIVPADAAVNVWRNSGYAIGLDPQDYSHSERSRLLAALRRSQGEQG